MARVGKAISATCVFLAVTSHVVVGDKGTIRAAAGGNQRNNRKLQWSYKDEDWLGNNSGDKPTLLAMKHKDDRYCLAVRSKVAKGQILKAAACKPSDARQLFFLDQDKRWRPSADLSLCVDGGDLTEGRFLKLGDCVKKGSRQRWTHGTSGPIRPRDETDLCASYKNTPADPLGEDIELVSEKQKDKCIDWVEMDPDKMDENGPPTKEEVEIDPPSTDLDDDTYVMITSKDEYDGYPKAMNVKNCLTATNADSGEIKLKECDKNSPKQLWAVEDSKGDYGEAIRIRPKSDPSLCVQIGEIDAPEDSIHCCVDNKRISLKKCSGSTKQHWTHNEYGEIHHAQYSSLCINDWLGSSVGMAHCGFDYIRKYSYDEYRWDIVKPSDLVPLPPKSEPREEDMFVIAGVEGYLLKSNDKGTYLDVEEGNRDEGNDGKLGYIAETLWFRDGSFVRSVSNPMSCLEYDEAYRHLSVSLCYRYKQDNQKILYNENGNKELSTAKIPTLCAAPRGEEVPSFEKCNGEREQRWEIAKLGVETDCNIPDENYVMFLNRGEYAGYYCAMVDKYYLGKGEELPLAIDECDQYTDEQLWLYTGKHLKPKVDRSLCLEFDNKNERAALTKCKEGMNSQKWIRDGDTFRPFDGKSLCATVCNIDDEWPWSGNLVCLKECAGKDTQNWDMVAPEDYKKPTLPFVHITPKGSKDSGIWCYPDREESPGGCPSIINIDTVTGKFHKESLWLIEDATNGIYLRKNEPRGDLLGVTENDCDEWIFHYGDWDCKKEGYRASFEPSDTVDKEKVTWRYNDDGNQELKSLIDTSLCLDRSSLSLLPCDGSRDQAWIFQDAQDFKYQAGIKSLGEPSNDDYNLVVSQQDKNYCVSTKESYRPGYDWRDEGLRMVKCDETDPKQLWVSESISGGGKRWRLRDNLSLCMRVSNVELMQELELHVCDDQKTKQKWIYDSKGDNEIAPYKRNGDLCISYESCTPRFGDKIGLRPCNGKIEQGFDLVKPGEYRF